jgi:hypothetical protein
MSLIILIFLKLFYICINFVCNTYNFNVKQIEEKSLRDLPIEKSRSEK